MANAKRRETPEKPKCRNHPDEAGTYRCDNCGKLYCEKCVKGQGYGRFFCAECELLILDFLDLI
ncbi:MAG: hypothetical protein GTO24_04900 [candidate division Zixibacteria bacterium]|nr:hypothetical protein [candidate division Zixibacteria bacterium]